MAFAAIPEIFRSRTFCNAGKTLALRYRYQKHSFALGQKYKFLASLPTPPPGKKYVWDNRLQVTLAAN